MSNQLDLVFICDCTGSMGSYLQAAKESIEAIITDINKEEKCDVRFALVEYRDHPPEDQSFPTRLTDFTDSIKTAKEAVDRMEAQGGGDGPESVSCAFDVAANLKYRESAAKFAVWIADAPPHGFGDGGDGFPDGCPCGKDILVAVRTMMSKDIVVYTVGCEPLGFEYLRTLMRAVAELTGGQYCALSSAKVLGQMITYSAIEEIEMKKIVDEVRKEVENDKDFKFMTKKQQQEYVMNKIKEKTTDKKIKSVTLDSIFKEELPPVPECFLHAENLKSLVKEMKKDKDIKPNFKDGYRDYYDSDDYIDSEEEDGYYKRGAKGYVGKHFFMDKLKRAFGRSKKDVRMEECCEEIDESSASSSEEFENFTAMEKCAASKRCAKEMKCEMECDAIPPAAEPTTQKVNLEESNFSSSQMDRLFSRTMNFYDGK